MSRYSRVAYGDWNDQLPNGGSRVRPRESLAKHTCSSSLHARGFTPTLRNPVFTPVKVNLWE